MNCVPYTGKDPFIYASFAKADSAAVLPVLAEMQKAGYRIWYVDGSLLGQNADDVIAEHIDACTCFLAVLSARYIASDICKDEISFATDLGKKGAVLYWETLSLPSALQKQTERLTAVHREQKTANALCMAMQAVEAFALCREATVSSAASVAPAPLPKMPEFPQPPAPEQTPAQASPVPPTPPVSTPERTVPPAEKEKTLIPCPITPRKCPKPKRKGATLKILVDGVPAVYNGRLLGGIPCGTGSIKIERDGKYIQYSGTFYLDALTEKNFREALVRDCYDAETGSFKVDLRFGGTYVFWLKHVNGGMGGEWYDIKATFDIRRKRVKNLTISFTNARSKLRHCSFKNEEGVEMKDGTGQSGTETRGSETFRLFGKMTYPNGDTFEGAVYGTAERGFVIAGGVRERGKLFRRDGSFYDGEWLDGVQSGCGTFHWANGAVYDGEWAMGHPHGHGKMKTYDGKLYEGEWASGEMHGRGKMVFTDGSSYDGDWKHNQRTGRGVYRWRNGDVYEGDFINGKTHGHGVHRRTDGVIYDGEFLDNQPTGNGIMRYPDGRTETLRNGKSV